MVLCKTLKEGLANAQRMRIQEFWIDLLYIAHMCSLAMTVRCGRTA
jgi:hypothetical protein